MMVHRRIRSEPLETPSLSGELTCDFDLGAMLHEQTFHKPCDARRTSSGTFSSAHQHQTMAPKVDRLRPRERMRTLTELEGVRESCTLKNIAEQFQRASLAISRTIRRTSTRSQGFRLPQAERACTYTSRYPCLVALAVKQQPFWLYDRTKKWYGFNWSNWALYHNP